MTTINLTELEAEVWKYVLNLKDSPAARIASREAFYLKYGHGSEQDKYGYGVSEIAFIRWEDRGVLEPPHTNPPGSEWWSEVNLWFIYLSELGNKAHEIGFPTDQLPIPAQFWVAYIQNPSPKTWYQAHNSSIIDGYLKYPHLAAKEDIHEQVFINKVLYRLLLAQSMVEGDFIFPRLFKFIANPKGRSVEIITHFGNFYPEKYPLTAHEKSIILGKTYSLEEFGVKFLDDVIIEPELTHIYRRSAIWNNQPDLITLEVDQKPCYPIGSNLPDTYKGIVISILIWIRKLLFKSK